MGIRPVTVLLEQWEWIESNFTKGVSSLDFEGLFAELCFPVAKESLVFFFFFLARNNVLKVSAWGNKGHASKIEVVFEIIQVVTFFLTQI